MLKRVLLSVAIGGAFILATHTVGFSKNRDGDNIIYKLSIRPRYRRS